MKDMGDKLESRHDGKHKLHSLFIILKASKKHIPWHSETWLDGYQLFESESVENIFYLHAAIFEISK